MALETVEELLTQPAAHQPGLTVSDYLNEVIAKTGEDIRVRRFVRYQGDLVAAYIHHGGKIGVMLELSGGGTAPEALAAAKDLAMQVAAANPLAVGREEMDAGHSSPRRRPSTRPRPPKAASPPRSSKRWWPAAWRSFIRKSASSSRPFVKNPDITVTQFLKEVGAKLGGKELKVKRFIRYQVGA